MSADCPHQGAGRAGGTGSKGVQNDTDSNTQNVSRTLAECLWCNSFNSFFCENSRHFSPPNTSTNEYCPSALLVCTVREGERERERERQRQRQRQRDRQRDRQRHRERHTHTQRHRETERDKETERDRDTERACSGDDSRGRRYIIGYTME